MKAVKYILIFVILPIVLTSQNVMIEGKVINYKTLQPMTYTQILFDSTYQVAANDDGEFKIEVPKEILKDTLKIRFIGCFNLNFINFPANHYLIDLGTIPIFEYFPGYDMTHFGCADDDYDCKEKERKHIEKEKNRIEKYFDEINTVISYFDFRFQNRTYKIDIQSGCINLGTEN